MVVGTASGELLPPYIAYKAEKMWDAWIENGPTGARYNRSRSGWLDNACFEDWFQTTALPFCERKSGQCVLIGNNLSSHFSRKIIELCNENNIAFCCLPPNSIHLCQPLNVSFFRPTKVKWKTILTEYKQGRGKHAQTVQKDQFLKLLKKLIDSLEPNRECNIKAGFKKTGVFPLSFEPILKSPPQST